MVYYMLLIFKAEFVGTYHVCVFILVDRFVLHSIRWKNSQVNVSTVEKKKL